MDPHAAWTELLQALLDDDWPAACEAAETLADWLQSGGFAPQIVTQFPPEHPWHRRFARAVCTHMLQAAGDRDAIS